MNVNLYREVKPHEYKETKPYRGCVTCGYGPGASFHNYYEVRAYLEEQRLEQLRIACDA